MKSNCKSLRLSILLAIIFSCLTFLFICLFLNYRLEIFEIIMNLLIGLLGSTMVALLLNIPTYNVSKRQLLESYWEEVERLTRLINKVDYLFCDYDSEVVISYIHSLKQKPWIDEFNKVSKKKIPADYKKYKEILVKCFQTENTELKEKLSKHGFDIYSSEQVDKYLQKFKTEYDEIINEYINLSKESTSKLNVLIGNMEFLCGKKKMIEIHKKTYQPLYELLNKIKEEAYHFNLYLKGEGNEAVCVEKVLELQKELFNVKYENNSEIIYDSFCDNLSKESENLRAYIYNIVPEYLEIHPRYVRMKNIKARTTKS